MLAIIGPNGAGKTTMMDIITGKTRPDDGEVLFDGRTDLTKLDEAAIANLGIGRKFQKPTVFESHTVWDNLELALKKPRGALRALTYVAASDRHRAHRRNPRHHSPHRRKDDLAAGLSHGQKQWLEIGMLLAQDPKLLLVDEPVAGMTDAETVETAKLLKRDRQDPLRGGGRARHELRPRTRHPRHLPRRRLGAGRRHAGPGQRKSGGDRKVSGTMSSSPLHHNPSTSTTARAQALRRHHHRVPAGQDHRGAGP